MGEFAVGRHDGDRASVQGARLVGSRNARTGCVADVGLAEEHEGVETVVRH